jgi:hypothetical protein
MNLRSEQSQTQAQSSPIRPCGTVVDELSPSAARTAGGSFSSTPAAVGFPFPPAADDEQSVADWSSLPAIEVESVDLQHMEPEVAQMLSVQLETRGTSSHALQGSLWRSGEVFAASVAAKLREFGRFDLCEPLEHCHTESVNLRCSGCKRVNTVWNRCDLFYCPRCQPRLARERAEGVEWWAKQIGQPKHVVLTLTNTPTLTKEMVRYAVKSFARLRRMKVFSQVSGGFYRLEVTNEGRGWHLHIHVLCDVRFLDSGLLAIKWNEANRGFGHIVKVKDCRCREYLNEVTKYAVKGSDLAKWSAADISTFVDAFKGVRSFGVFGVLYGKRTEWKEWLSTLAEKRATCVCGCSDYKVCSDKELEWLELHVNSPVDKLPASTKQFRQLELGKICSESFNLSSAFGMR